MTNRKYGQQLKDTVINEVIIGEGSAAQVARDHQIPESSANHQLFAATIV